ncbi:MAG: hypothetical protein J6K58_10280 [Lachnospiraceae bacterium]|nr:hypothetical protein [Lachnospiraceae bacterium]
MNKQQLGSLILESQESLYRVAKSLLNNDADCGDAICETIARAFEKLHTLKSDTFDIGMTSEGENITLQVKVKDVTVMDNISGLDERFLNDTIWDEAVA